MQSNESCQLAEQYLGYLTVIKRRSENTVKEYRTDLLMFLSYVMELRKTPIPGNNFAKVNIDFLYKYGRVDIRSLQQILGHVSVAITEIYTHIDEHQLQSAVNSNPLAMMFN
ncbi:site-specific tyrosine recombinase XerC [Desulfosporosinus sp. OT]|nr:site-specific tyrosine recombinase XerC [Desulfosporosinus sp. OT]